jgi:hypothetical protein
MAAAKPGRSKMYFAGLILGLVAMAAIFQAKRAMMPKFHEVQETREEVTLTTGSTVHVVYSDEPGYFLPPGFGTALALYRKKEDGSYTSVGQLGYNELSEKDPQFPPIAEEGTYNLTGNFFICANPRVADCAKLEITQTIRVERNATLTEDKVAIPLMQLAQDGLKAGNADDPRNALSGSGEAPADSK